MIRRALLAVFAVLLSTGAAWAPSGERLVVWAWERPEDLRFLPPDVEVAALSGFIEIKGEDLTARGRRFPLKVRPGQVSTSVVHVQIDRSVPLRWTPELRARTAAAIVTLARHIPAGRVQIDFEVHASERQSLVDLVHDVKRALPSDEELSMTALASWCETEDWAAKVGADEVAPMLFRMGPWGEAIRARLASGEDFSEPACRRALAVSLDSPLVRAPSGRRIYLFNPRSWTDDDFEQIRGEVEGWRTRDGVRRSPRG